MKIYHLILLPFSFLPVNILVAQVIPDSLLHTTPPSFKEFRFSLPEKAIEIKWIEYEKTKVPMHGKLAPDGNSIIIRNYQPGQPLRVMVILLSGKIVEYIKSPCFIDPVTEVL